MYQLRVANLNSLPTRRISAKTLKVSPPDHSFIHLAFENVEPLMSMNLTPSERALENLRFATVLLHETAVCDFLVDSGLH